MRVQVFTVLDSKIGSFAQPWFSVNVETAVRAFSEALRDPQSMLSKHPEDFSLWLLGYFDDDSGMFEQDKPTNLGNATLFMRKDS